jgi:hypothetical protein
MLSRQLVIRAMLSRHRRVERSLGQDDHSVLERQAADALRRARKLPVGPDRNELRQLAVGLLWLHRNSMNGLLEGRLQSISSGAISV